MSLSAVGVYQEYVGWPATSDNIKLISPDHPSLYGLGVFHNVGIKCGILVYR